MIEHGRVGRRHPLDQLQQPPELGALADEGARRGRAASGRARAGSRAAAATGARAPAGSGPRARRAGTAWRRSRRRPARIDSIAVSIEPCPVSMITSVAGCSSRGSPSAPRGRSCRAAAGRAARRRARAPRALRAPRRPSPRSRPRSRRRSSSPRQHLAEGVVVVDEQERGPRASRGEPPSSGARRRRQHDLERRSAARRRSRPRCRRPSGGRSSATGTGRGRVPPLRRLKNGSKIRFWCSGGDAAAVVGDADAQRVVAARRSSVTWPPGAAGLDGVQQQVDERVLQLRLVRAHVEARRQRPDVDPHAVRRAPSARSAGRPRATRRLRGRRGRPASSGRATAAGSAG